MNGGLDGLLRSRAAAHPNAELLRFAGGSTWTVAEADARASEIAAVLTAAGVRPGDRVAVQARNTPTLPLMLFAAARMGAVLVPVNPAYGESDLLHVLGDCGCTLVVADDDLAAECDRAAAALPAPPGVIAMSDLLSRCGGALPPAPAVAVDDTTLLSLQYTSGTTGMPKACMLTQGYWTQVGAIAAEAFALGPGDVALTAQAFTYMDPQWSLVMCLHAGVPLVVLPRFSASTFWASVVEHDVTVFYLMGSMATMLLRQEPVPHESAHHVRLAMASGIPPSLHSQMEARWGIPWREAFGMTETGVDLIVAADDAASVGTGDLGRPVATKRIRIVTADGVPVGEGEAGELQVSGEPMMLGYWHRPEDTARVLRDGWLSTGDIVECGADGRLRIVGRLKDMVRRAGENIACAEVEDALSAHPDVLAAAVIPVADDVRGEEAAAVVAITRGVQRTSQVADALRDHVRSRLAGFKVPRYVVLLDELPMTSSGKVAKSAISHDWGRLAPQAFDAERPWLDVDYGVSEGIATITVSRPAVLNALREQTLVELARALECSAQDPAVRVVVLTGQGRAFCAGQDLDELADRLDHRDGDEGPGLSESEVSAVLASMQAITALLLAHPRPTIAALNGVAVGAGAELAAACDVRIASSRARIGFVEAARGLFQTNGITWLLPRIVGMSRALELMMTARLMSADEAERMGLVNYVVDDDDFAGAVRDFCAGIAANAPLSVSQAVHLVRHAYDHGIGDAMDLEIAATARCLASDDVREGTRAFHERRTPTYQGT